MAVVLPKCTAVANSDASPAVKNSANLQNGNPRIHRGVWTAANGDSIGSIFRFARVRSSDLIHSIVVRNEALGGSAEADVGVYQTAENGGAVVDADRFGSAVSLVSASLGGVDVTHEAGTTNAKLADREKVLWQMLGLAADPGIYYDLALTLTGASAAAATVAVDTTVISAE